MGTVGNLKRLLVVGGATALLVLLAASVSDAAKVVPVLLPGASNEGKTCDDLEGAGQTWTELKVDPNADGTFSDGTLTVTITHTSPDKVFDWTSNIGVDAVVVKAGADGSFLYRYDPPNEETSDTGLTSPSDEGNAISHIAFCYEVDATLTVIKRVVNDSGGTAVASDWTMNVAGPTPLSFPGAEAPGTKNVVLPGAYTVTESGGPSGYALTYSGDCDASGNVTIPPFHDRTCTLTNDDQPATLIVKKIVVNDHGGTKVASDFSFQLNGGAAQAFEADGQNNLTVNAGTYSVTEPAVAGYATSYDNCASIQLAPGGTATCTVTNNDQPATLIVKKVVVNDDGGTATADDFSFSVNGGAAQSFEADGQNEITLAAGTYSVTEPAVAGYTTTYGNCSNLVIPNGGSATCTITNDDEEEERPTLTVIKHVINDDGGTAVAGDWTMNVAGPTPLSFPGAEAPGTKNAVLPGAYVVTESGGPAGYILAYSGDCDANGNVTIPPLHDRTCVLTNDDRPAHLIVRKVVVNDNGGTATTSDFSFQVDGGPAQPFEADGQNELEVAPGVHTVTEPAKAGYATTYSNCDHVSIPLGGSATCTITNNDVPRGQGTISVSKSADPTSLKEPGGLVTYSVRITNTSLDIDLSITNVVDDKFGDLDDSGGSGCFDVPINLAPGQFASCQFQRQITGVGGTSHVNTVTATGVDENGNPVSGSDDARVDILPRLIDLVIVKEASSPTPLNGIVHYTLTVTNKGPDPATNVQLADPAPAGITYLSASPSQGTCSVSPSLVTCNLGTIAPGQTVTVRIDGRATTVGRHVNTATVTGSGGRETNPADNVDDAETVVPAPLVPPSKPKPTPKPKPEICLTLTVSPKMIKADGKPDRLVAKVTAGKKHVRGVRVLVSGVGVRETGRTNGRGIAVIQINPRRAGILTITTIELGDRRSCGPKRVGVVGVFLPPVTG